MENRRGRGRRSTAGEKMENKEILGITKDVSGSLVGKSRVENYMVYIPNGPIRPMRWRQGILSRKCMLSRRFRYED